MRSMKFALAGAIALALTGSLAACSGSSNGPVGGGEVSTELPATDTTETINIWGYVGPGDDAWIKSGQAKLKEEFPNVTVKYTYVAYDQIAPKLLGTAVSGGAPDGIIYNPADAINLSQAGILADMAPFWNEYADAKQFPDSVVWKDGEEVLSVQGYVNTTALYYNKTLLDGIGATPPKTVEELNETLKKVKDAGLNGMTISAVPTAESEFQILPWLFGDGQNYGSWDKTAVTKVFTQFDDWIKAGYIPKDIVGWSQGDGWDRFAGGKYAFSQNGNWKLGDGKKLPFEWGVVPIPAGTAGSFSVGGGEGLSIGAKSKNAALTWEFFKVALLDKDAEIQQMKTAGSIPARADAAEDPAIASDPNLQAFAEVVASMKSRPASVDMADYMLQMGKIWNSVAGGQLSPSEGAEEVVTKLNAIK